MANDEVRDYLAEALRIADEVAERRANPAMPLPQLLPERRHIVALLEELRRKETELDRIRREIRIQLAYARGQAPRAEDFHGR